MAQDLVITGEINDIAGNPLTGATVSITELPGLGTAVGPDGTYTLRVPSNRLNRQSATLIVRFVSYRTERTEITLEPGQIVRDFTLRDDLLQLDEVVVTGQGSVTDRRRLSSPIETISARQIENSTATSVDQLLQGNIPGANVRLQSAQPGQAGLINLRGITSATGSQTPVIYIDGIRVDNDINTSPSGGGESTSAIADLLVSDIERIEVTKGGAASTLFGSDASNGVIQIFTKRGVSGAPRISIRSEQGVDIPIDQFLTDTGFAFPNQVENPDNPNFGQNRFLKDNFLQNGYFQSYSASISGGTPDLLYSMSGQIRDSEGVQPLNDNTSYNFRGTMRVNFEDNLNLDISAGYTRSQFNRIFNGEAIADPLTAFEVGDAFFFSGQSSNTPFQDVLDVFLDGGLTEKVDRFQFSGSLGYNPIPTQTNKLTAGIDFRSNSQRNSNSAFSDDLFGTQNGFIQRFDREAINITLEYVGEYSHTISPVVTSITKFGAQGFRRTISTFVGSGENFALPGIDDFGNAGTINASENRRAVFSGGFFAVQEVDLYDRWFLNAGLRLDGNSAFGSDIGLVAYPRAGAAYELSAEDFWRDTFGSAWGQMKLRASYGETGNFPEEFRRDLTFSATAFRDESAPRFANPGNDELNVERTRTWEFGFDAAFWEERVGVNFTWFSATTDDALFFVPEPPALGRGSQQRNVGTIENEGLEVFLRANLIRARNFDFTINSSFSTFTNEVTDMGTAPDFTAGTRSQRVSLGQPVGAWWVTTPVDSNGDGLLDSSETQFTGSTPFPLKTGSVGFQARFFNQLSVSANADYAWDFEVFDAGGWWSWFNGLDRAVFPDRFDLDGNPDGSFNPTTARVVLLEPGDYFKLREVSVRYELPQSFKSNLGLINASVFATGRNLWMWTKSDKLDPEMSGVNAGGSNLQLGGAQSITLPAPTQLRFGVAFTF
ncbi:MAG: SusC/RagA family TonB-linked outer membrane protein [Balneolaceae bacterium]